MVRDGTTYFRSGRRECLVGGIGLGVSGERCADRIGGYFARWCLRSPRVSKLVAFRHHAGSFAEEAVGGIQGAIVLSRALGDKGAFERIVGRHETNLLNAASRFGG